MPVHLLQFSFDAYIFLSRSQLLLLYHSFHADHQSLQACFLLYIHTRFANFIDLLHHVCPPSPVKHSYKIQFYHCIMFVNPTLPYPHPLSLILPPMNSSAFSPHGIVVLNFDVASFLLMCVCVDIICFSTFTLLSFLDSLFFFFFFICLPFVCFLHVYVFFLFSSCGP